MEVDIFIPKLGSWTVFVILELCTNFSVSQGLKQLVNNEHTEMYVTHQELSMMGQANGVYSEMVKLII
jgi:hypothetical protein